jgi:WS/DGAT/MGAT family acyltransferase
MERLSTQDASFLYLENDTNHMSIAALAIFEGPAPKPGEIEAMVLSKLDLLPRYRQRVRFVPLDLGLPVWCDDPAFKLSNHVNHEALPAPGSDEELQKMVSRVMARQLNRNRPLWELLIIEGLEDGGWGMLMKLHHCVADGVAATDLLTHLLDDDPEAPLREVVNWEPESEPSSAELTKSAMADGLEGAKEGLELIQSALKSPGRTAREAGEFIDGLASYRRPTALELESSLNGPIGPYRNWRWTSTTLAKIKKIRAAHGGTVNDVVLAVITRGFRSLLQSRGEPVEDHVVRSLVPVSVRHEDEQGLTNNRVSAMFAELPVGLEDPVQRLHSISEQMNNYKEHHQAAAGETLTSLQGLAPPALVALGARLFTGIEQHMVQTVTTNVPGPRYALYAVGRKMRRAYLYVPIAGSVRIGVAMFSYGGKLTFAVTGDSEHAPDTQILCEGIEAGMAELLDRSLAE